MRRSQQPSFFHIWQLVAVLQLSSLSVPWVLANALVPKCPANGSSDGQTTVLPLFDMEWYGELYPLYVGPEVYCARVYIERENVTLKSSFSPDMQDSVCASSYIYRNRVDDSTITTEGETESCLIYYVGSNLACLASCEVDYDCYVDGNNNIGDGVELEFGSCSEAANAFATQLPGIDTLGASTTQPLHVETFGAKVSEISISSSNDHAMFRGYKGPDLTSNQHYPFFLFRASNCDGMVNIIKYDGNQTTNLLNETSGDCSNLDSAVYYKDKVYFSIPSDGNLWVTEGNPADTQVLKQVNSTGTELHEFLVFNDMIYFIEGDNRLWKSNGTEEGTIVVEEFDSGLSEISAAGNDMLLLTFRSLNMVRVSDGNSASMILTTEAIDPSISKHPPFVQGKALFTSEPGLWSTEGTNETTQKISNLDVRNFAPDVIHGVALFSVRMGFVFSTDGTAEGTTPINFTENVEGVTPSMSVSGYPGSTSEFGGSIRFIPVLNDRFTFSVNGFGPGVSDSFDLWTTDGTESGSVLIKRLYSFESYHTVPRLSSGMALIVNSQADQWWITDGTAANTKLLVRFFSSGSLSGGSTFTELQDGSVLIYDGGGTLWRIEIDNEGETAEVTSSGQNTTHVESTELPKGPDQETDPPGDAPSTSPVLAPRPTDPPDAAPSTSPILAPRPTDAPSTSPVSVFVPSDVDPEDIDPLLENSAGRVGVTVFAVTTFLFLL